MALLHSDCTYPTEYTVVFNASSFSMDAGLGTIVNVTLNEILDSRLAYYSIMMSGTNCKYVTLIHYIAANQKH